MTQFGAARGVQTVPAPICNAPGRDTTKSIPVRFVAPQAVAVVVLGGATTGGFLSLAVRSQSGLPCGRPRRGNHGGIAPTVSSRPLHLTGGCEGPAAR